MTQPETIATTPAPAVAVAADAVTALSAQDRVAAITHGGRSFTPQQVKLIMDTVAKGATVDELRLFLAICGRTGLDPFTRQIHFVKRWDSKLGREVGVTQTGIDGYRLIAQRTKEYAGQGPKRWCGDDGSWCDVWLKDGPPAAAQCEVFRKGIDRPFVAVARYKAYAVKKQDGSPTAMWARMDAEQLAKCAEALALRMAFPNELSDLYTDDEMHQAADLADAPSVSMVPGRGLEGLKAALALPVTSETAAPAPAVAEEGVIEE